MDVDAIDEMFQKADMQKDVRRITETVANVLGESLYRSKRVSGRKLASYTSSRGSMLEPKRTDTFRLASGGDVELHVEGFIADGSFVIRLHIPSDQLGARWIRRVFRALSDELSDTPFVFSVHTKMNAGVAG